MLTKTPIVVCLINFMIAATMGLLLRYAVLGGIPFNYQFLIHGHSHVAMLGWLYLCIYVLLVDLVVKTHAQLFYRLFWLTQLSVIGMMISFPVQGYALVSITFSTLHIFCSYFFVYHIWKHLKNLSIVSKLLVKAALIFMLISTIGVWFLGYTMKAYGSDSILYDLAIQWFLHFQFNGWFVFAVLGLVSTGISQTIKRIREVICILVISVILTAALPAYWHTMLPVFFWLNVIGSLLQFLVLVSFCWLIIQKIDFKKHGFNSKILIYFGMGSLLLKSAFQLTTLSESLVFAAFENRNLIIGFIHLLMLGAISSLLFYMILKFYRPKSNQLTLFGIFLFLTGIVTSELLMFFQALIIFSGGNTFQFYYWSLFYSSLLIALGLIVMITNVIFAKNINTSTN